MKKKDDNINVDINGVLMSYSVRELSQLIRRKMLTRTYKDKTKYTRKDKHKKPLI